MEEWKCPMCGTDNEREPDGSIELVINDEGELVKSDLYECDGCMMAFDKRTVAEFWAADADKKAKWREDMKQAYLSTIDRMWEENMQTD